MAVSGGPLDHAPLEPVSPPASCSRYTEKFKISALGIAYWLLGDHACQGRRVGYIPQCSSSTGPFVWLALQCGNLFQPSSSASALVQVGLADIFSSFGSAMSCVILDKSVSFLGLGILIGQNRISVRWNRLNTKCLGRQTSLRKVKSLKGLSHRTCEF